MVTFAHVNIIAKDRERLIHFYKTILQCKSIHEKRDLRGDWLDRLTGISGAHIRGEHLSLPGYGEISPTLEIFSYDEIKEVNPPQINQSGIVHLAFAVDDVEETLAKILLVGGGQIGEVVQADYEDGKKAVFVYATDIEGNILELQSWIKPTF